MNALVSTGTNQASLLAAFTLPLANTAPVVQATPVFLNIISLMLSPSDPAAQLTSLTAGKALMAKPPANAQATAASPAQIVDAMIRSMLASGNAMPSSSTTASPAPNGSPAPLAPSNTALAAIPAPVTASGLNPVPPPATATANPNQPTPAPRKQVRTIADLPMAITVVAAPVQPDIVPAPPVTLSADAPTATTPAPAGTQESPVPVSSGPPPAGNQPEAKVAFTAVLTPMKETPAITVAEPFTPEAVPAQIAPSPEPSVNVPASSRASASDSSQPPSTPGLAQSAIQPSTGQAGGDMRQNAGASSQQQNSQQNDSAETPATPIAASPDAKIKPAVQQDDNALQAAAAAPGVVHPPVILSFAAASPADATHPAASTPSSVSAAPVTPYNATAEALRTTESNLPAVPQVRTGAAQEISIRIAPPDSPAVDLRVVERSGQVHVDVRTSDSAMQTSLRQNLGTLTNSLERAGYHTETFTPSSTLSRAASSAQTGNQDNQRDPSQNRGGAGDFSGERRQQQQQKRPGAWLEEFEEQP